MAAPTVMLTVPGLITLVLLFGFSHNLLRVVVGGARCVPKASYRRTNMENDSQEVQSHHHLFVEHFPSAFFLWPFDLEAFGDEPPFVQSLV